MKNKLHQMGRLLQGKFVPYLTPYWGLEEGELIDAWQRTSAPADAVEELERYIQNLLGIKSAIQTVNLGRSGIQLALEAMDLKQESEVIVPSFGCSGTIVPIIQAGLIPVLVDCDSHLNIKMESIKEAHSDKVRAIILPHLSGLWAHDADEIFKWAREKNIYVIEDCAQSLGLKKNGQWAGLNGDVGIFSCHGGKQIVSSAGAWVVFKNEDLYKKSKNKTLNKEPEAFVKKRVNQFFGQFKSSNRAAAHSFLWNRLTSIFSSNQNRPRTKLSDFQFDIFALTQIEAALILLQLKKLEKIIAHSQENAAFWRESLASWSSSLKFLPTENNVQAKMTVLFEGDHAASESEKLKWTLIRNAIGIESSYQPLHLREPFSKYRQTKMPVLDQIWKHCFILPNRPNLSEFEKNWIKESLQKPVGA